MSPDPVTVARELADDLLFPAAAAIDASDAVGKAYLDALAGAGLYGLVGPRFAGGLDADPTTAGRVVEALGGASLATAFVWIQHHSPVRAVAATEASLRDRWLAPLCCGEARAGIAYAALRRPGPPAAVATRHGSGWILNGSAPWVTGWGLVDVILVGARCGPDVVWLLVDATAGPAMVAAPLALAALQASATFSVRWQGHPVPDDRVVGVEPFDEWVRRDAAGRQMNGYLAIGVAARCCRLLGPSALDASVNAARDALDRATTASVAGARADACVLAVRASAALVASGGGRAMDAGSHSARLAREAAFLLVFGQASDIRAAQLEALKATPRSQA